MGGFMRKIVFFLIACSFFFPGSGSTGLAAPVDLFATVPENVGSYNFAHELPPVGRIGQNSGLFDLSIAWYTQDTASCGFTCMNTGPLPPPALAFTTASTAASQATPEPSSVVYFSCALLFLWLGSTGKRRKSFSLVKH